MKGRCRYAARGSMVIPCGIEDPNGLCPLECFLHSLCSAKGRGEPPQGRTPHFLFETSKRKCAVHGGKEKMFGRFHLTPQCQAARKTWGLRKRPVEVGGRLCVGRGHGPTESFGSAPREWELQGRAKPERTGDFFRCRSLIPHGNACGGAVLNLYRVRRTSPMPV